MDLLEYFWVLVWAGLIISYFAFFFNWRQAIFERDQLYKAIYEADNKTGFVEKMEPEHFVLPQFHHIIFPGEKVSPYEECLTYEILRNACMRGKIKSYE